MEIPVFVEPVAGNGYVAKTGEPLPLRVEGATEAEALAKIQIELTTRLRNGGRLTNVSVPPEPHPWVESSGIFSPDDPIVKEWIEIMGENRRKADAEPDMP